MKQNTAYNKEKIIFVGMLSYCERYNKTIYDVSMTMGPTPKFTGPQVQEIARQMEAMVPLDQLQQRRAWRDMCLTKLAQLKIETKQ